jgi:CRISPR-associated protein Cmr5
MKTIEQEYASIIYSQVRDFGSNYPKDSQERKMYGSMAHKLPILVRTAGLTQALAFADSRGREAHHELLEHLAQVVVGNNLDNYLEKSRESELQDYIYLSRRTLLALNWFKRFAQSVLEVDPTDESLGDQP